VLAAADVSSPADRTIDGRSLLQATEGRERVTNRVVFGQQGEKIASVREQRWKLHVQPNRELKFRRDQPWVDKRAPDGVTILAPYEQFTPDDYPGISTGETAKALMLFDLTTDPGEQYDVSAENPEVVARLRQLSQAARKELIQTTGEVGTKN
jgi:arylsulfatase A-like enzyme